MIKKKDLTKLCDASIDMYKASLRLRVRKEKQELLKESMFTEKKKECVEACYERFLQIINS